MGSKLGEAISQADTYVSHPNRDFRVTDEVLRLRRDGKANFITYKGPKIDRVTKTRLELELPLPNGEEIAQRFVELLGLLGFEVVVDVRKRRRKTQVAWDGDMVEVALDEVEGLGKFVELEAIAEEAGLDEAKRRVASLAARLGLTRNERLSYSELVIQAKG